MAGDLNALRPRRCFVQLVQCSAERREDTDTLVAVIKQHEKTWQQQTMEYKPSQALLVIGQGGRKYPESSLSKLSNIKLMNLSFFAK